jgi:hypothetical protein
MSSHALFVHCYNSITWGLASATLVCGTLVTATESATSATCPAGNEIACAEDVYTAANINLELSNNDSCCK